MNDRLLKKLILETIQEVLSEGSTPEKKKELKKKADELYKKYHDLEEERIDIGFDIDGVEGRLEVRTVDKRTKERLRKELVSLKEKFKKKTEETDTAWEAFEAAKKKLGGDYSRSSKDED